MLVIPASERPMKHLGLESSLGSRVGLSQKFKHNNVTKLPLSFTRSLNPAKASHMISSYALELRDLFRDGVLACSDSFSLV